MTILVEPEPLTDRQRQILRLVSYGLLPGCGLASVGVRMTDPATCDDGSEAVHGR